MPDPPTSRSQMANFMTFPRTAKTQVSGNDIVIGTDRLLLEQCTQRDNLRRYSVAVTAAAPPVPGPPWLIEVAEPGAVGTTRSAQ